MLRSQQNHQVSASQLLIHLLLITHITDGSDVIKKMAREQIDILHVIASLILQQIYYSSANKTAGPNQYNFHILILYFENHVFA